MLWPSKGVTNIASPQILEEYRGVIPELNGGPVSLQPERTPPWRRSTAAVLLAITIASLLFSSLFQRYLGHVLADPNVDFRDYYFAAEMVRDNPRANLYEGATEGNPQLRSAPPQSQIAQRARHAGFDDIELYLYPPLFADLLTPLTHLPLPVAAQAWRLLNLAVVLGSVLLLARMLRMPVLSSSFVVLLTAAYAFWPVHEAVSLGQITVVLLGLWAVGVVAYAEGMPVLSAVALALATSFKVTPVLLLPVLLIWRDRRWLLAYSTAMLAFLGIMGGWNGPATLRDYAHVVSGMGGVLPAMGNKCIAAVTAWLYYGLVFDLGSVHAVLGASPPILVLLTRTLSLLFYGACLVLVWRGRAITGLRDRATVLAIFALATAVIAPVSWRHGYTVALLPLVILWSRWLPENRRNWTIWTLALTSIAVGSLGFDLLAQGPLPQVLKIVLASIWPISALALCLGGLSSLQRHRELLPSDTLA